MRRVIVSIALLLALAISVALWSSRRETARPDNSGVSRVSPVPTKQAGAALSPPATPSPSSLETDFPLAASLNAPNSTVSRDLDVLQQMLDHWRSNFPREGNPVGENSDITAALTGDNRLGLALIPKKHRAINERGELCDRWGTPLRFHQLSGERMEIRSAGPDRKFATEDDAVWTPQ